LQDCRQPSFDISLDTPLKVWHFTLEECERLGTAPVSRLMSYTAKIQLTSAQQDELERDANSRTIAVRAMERVKIILGLAAGKTNREIAEQLGIAQHTVRRWAKRFLQQGTDGLEDAPRSGRPRLIGSEKVQQIVHKTTQETPADSTHWTTRSLAQVVNVSPSSVGRIWRSEKVQPHRVRTFKLSNDREFAEKTDDIVTLYLYPPANSVVWSADEQCQLQALRRTQPSLPCIPDHCATQTHDYKRNGTTNLFAAMNVHTGEIVYTFHPRHRHEEWIQFLSLIEAATRPGMEIHLIMDNYSAHKHAAVGLWLAEHPRFHIHWTPTSGSWLNAVERLFSDVTQKCLQRRSAESVPALEQAIGGFLNQRNQNPKPLKWKATAMEILRKTKRAWATLHDRYGAKKPSAALASIDRFLATAPS
jgi:transposase